MVESASKGEWGSAAVMEQLVPENSFVINKILSLDVPPLSPSIGLALKKVDVRSGFDVDVNMRHYWVPKEDNLIGSTTMATEHVASVVRLAVSEDQSFFASASHDGTSKIFELRQTDSGGELHSCLTYDGHKSGSEFSYHSRVNDVAILESSHSVATAASDGSLHVWKVDMVTSHQTQSSIHTKGSRVSGCSTLRQINPDEGEMMAVSHFNAPSASILAYATQRGHIHSLDLRCAREPFALNLRPELGYLTDMQVGDDKNWIVAGTSRGFLALWDIRFQAMVKLWRHGSDSPVKRLASASDSHTNGRKGSMYEASRPLIFMGCDNNEASLFDVSTGDCLQCYRTLDTSLSCVDQSALPMGCLSVPRLESVAIPRSCGKRQVSVDRALQMSTRSLIRDHSVNALVGSISREGPSYLLTGGSDQMIKYWDLNSASKCFCLSGLGRNQPPPSVERIDVGSVSQLFVCRQPSIPPARLTESSRLPSRNRQGIAKCSNRHQDSILDLKLIEEPMMGVLSSSRDGTIKLWA